VSAKDLGTGNEQKVTITASTNMSKEDIDKAVKDAERFAAEDKKEKERVEIRNNADSLVFQTEKTLKDLGDKVSSEDKGRIDAEISNVKSALAGTDSDAIKAATDRLSQMSYDVFGKVYQQANAQAGAAGGGGANYGGGQDGSQSAPHDDNVVDADYEVVDDDKDKK
jgi:molecular chaperone DnaK